MKTILKYVTPWFLLIFGMHLGILTVGIFIAIIASSIYLLIKNILLVAFIALVMFFIYQYSLFLDKKEQENNYKKRHDLLNRVEPFWNTSEK